MKNSIVARDFPNPPTSEVLQGLKVRRDFAAGIQKRLRMDFDNVIAITGEEGGGMCGNLAAILGIRRLG